MHSRSRRSKTKRTFHVVLEGLEHRVLLNGSSVLKGEVAHDAFGLSKVLGASRSADLGDHYYSGDNRVALLRRSAEFVVRLRDGALLPADEFIVTRQLDEHTVVAAALAIARQESASSMLESPEVVWAQPMFVTAEGGSRLAIIDEVIVCLRPGVDHKGFFMEGGWSYRRLAGSSDQFIVTVSEGGVVALEAATLLRSDPRVAWAAPNDYTDAAPATNDSLFGDQWYLHNTSQFGAKADADPDLPEAWATGYVGNNQIVVAVIDSGVDLGHPDLRIFTNPGEIAGNSIDDDRNGYIDDVHGWDFGSSQIGDNDPNPVSDETLDKHGTQVAGIAGAIGSNSQGITGAAQKVSILPIKLTDENGAYVTSARIAEAIRYAAGAVRDVVGEEVGQWRGADILNNSYRVGVGDPGNPAITSAFDWATSQGRGGLGATSFASSGNEANGDITDPGYREFSLNVSTVGNYEFEWRYQKNNTNSAGEDKAWLAFVRFPNGTVERFDTATPTLPTGWSTGGNAAWSIVDEPARTYGTGRYAARTGTIGNNQLSTLRSPVIPVSPSGTLKYMLWTSTEDNADEVRLWARINGGSWVDQNLAASGVPSTVATSVAFPASVTSVVAVGGTTDWDYRAHYSQFTPLAPSSAKKLDLVAPTGGGYRLITTTDRVDSAGDSTTNYWDSFTGTSASAPVVSGIAALLLAKNPTLTAAQLRTALIENAEKTGGNNGATAYTDVAGDNTSETWNRFYGYGRVNAADALAAVTADTVGPRVTKVTLTSADAASPIALWDVPTGSGQQILVSPVVDVKKISIQFDERVIISQNDLAMAGVTYNSTVTVSKFWVDYATNTATWELASPLPPDRFELTLSDNVRDFVYREAVGGQPLLDGNRLDGEFDNPYSVTQQGTGTFPSGDGTPGGVFCFRFTVLPGDHDRNHVVDIVDLNYVRNNFGATVSGGVLPQWLGGDMDFSGTVDVPDLNAVRNNFGAALTGDWPNTGCCCNQQLMAMAGEDTPAPVEYGEQALRKALVDLYHAKDADKQSAEMFWNLVGWDQLGDDAWWNELLGVASWRSVK